MIRLLFFILLLAACNQKEPPSGPPLPEYVVNEEFQAVLDTAGVQGVILVFDPGNNRFFSNNFQEADVRVLPASTFKIANSIVGLETGILENEHSVFTWDGEERALPVWEKDLTLKEAFQLSCVPCYQQLARTVGVERMNEQLTNLNYKTMDVNSETIDTFWLTGTSRISAMEQIDFLNRLYNRELPVSDSTYQTLTEILKIDRTDDHILSGKTGLALRDGGNIGWFVGYVEKGDDVYYFATRISPANSEMPGYVFSPLRKELTLVALNTLGIME